jgi:1,4-dihydroxy-6-naphthoate synthase
MDERTLTLGHSPDPDDAFMFYALARELIACPGFRFRHVVEDIQTLNERAVRGELDLTAISFHAYAYASSQYALLPCGASMGEGYGPILVAKRRLRPEEIAGGRLAVPGTLTSAFLALQLWLDRPAAELDLVVVPFDQVFAAVASGQAEAGLVIHEGQLTWRAAGLVVCEDLGAWWGSHNQGLPLPLGGNAIHKRLAPADRKLVADTVKASIQYGLAHRAQAVEHALQYARGLGRELTDQFVGMYVNDWTLECGPRGREAIRRFLGQAAERGFAPPVPELEFVV